MSNVFFTADTHFDHKKMLEIRPFKYLEEMNDVLIDRWNSVVKKGDRVYHLGDFGLAKPSRYKEIFDRLNGQIHLVVGNHDDKLKSEQRKLFASFRETNYIKVENQKIYLHHYACRVWRGSHKGSWCLYGHSHNELPEDRNLLSFDVGVDCWDFTPISFEQVKQKMESKNKEICFDCGVVCDSSELRTCCYGRCEGSCCAKCMTNGMCRFCAGVSIDLK